MGARGGARKVALVGSLIAVGLLALLFVTRPSPAVACEGAPAAPARIVTVVQGPMRPLFVPGDLVGIVDVAPTSLRRGDVVAFDPNSWGSLVGAPPFVLRVVAVAGDQVELQGGHVYVDGSELVEPYVFEDEPTNRADDWAPSTWTVPPFDVFVLGDHRSIAADSRIDGPLPVSSILGRATYRCAPDNRRGPIG